MGHLFGAHVERLQRLQCAISGFRLHAVLGHDEFQLLQAIVGRGGAHGPEYGVDDKLRADNGVSDQLIGVVGDLLEMATGDELAHIGNGVNGEVGRLLWLLLLLLGRW